jgi:transposase
MMIIGCDFHPSWQQVSWLDTETGETGERKLVHVWGDAKKFYEQLAAPVLIGMEATGNSQWFIELVQDLGHEIWVGDAAQIRASYVRKHAISKQGNRLVRSLLVEAAQIAVRFDPGMKKQYLHRCHQKPKGVAKVAAARKLAVRLYWMLRTQKPYPEIVRIESSPRVPLVGAS